MQSSSVSKKGSLINGSAAKQPRTTKVLTVDCRIQANVKAKVPSVFKKVPYSRKCRIQCRGMTVVQYGTGFMNTYASSSPSKSQVVLHGKLK